MKNSGRCPKCGSVENWAEKAGELDTIKRSFG